MAWFIVLILLLIALIGVLPFWPYSRSWGAVPAGVVVGVLLLMAVLLWLGVIAVWLPAGP